MSDGLPPLYFRIKENGAIVFRVGEEGRQRRLDLTPVAAVNGRTGEIKPLGGRSLTEAEEAEVRRWTEARQATLAARAQEDIARTIENLNMATHWAQAKADEATLEAVTDTLLLAMHDLRGVLVRKRAERLSREAGDEDDPDA